MTDLHLRFLAGFFFLLFGTYASPASSACETQKKKAVYYQTVEMQKGTWSYPLEHNPDDPEGDEESKRYCPNDTCTCEANISYVQFQIPSDKQPQALIDINKVLRHDAQERLCVNNMAYGSAEEEVTWDTTLAVSVKITGSVMYTGGNGSCHGVNDVHTFDVASGKEYLLKDILDVSRIAEARAALIQNIYEASKESEKSLKGSLAMVRNPINKITDEAFLNLGFFIEKGRVLVNTNEYYFSCASGNFHPGEIPLSLIKDDMRAKLGVTESCN